MSDMTPEQVREAIEIVRKYYHSPGEEAALALVLAAAEGYAAAQGDAERYPSPNDVAAWNERNFPDSPRHWPVMCAAEEVGELIHAVLKSEQGIRRNENHEAAIRDAIGDSVIALMSVSWREGLSFAGCVREAWEHVKDRDWRRERADALAAHHHPAPAGQEE